ncbi:hypothetical protein HID58_056497 [Brassica napus]|uniref:Uncharacterized protein n=1 Tax=Brassica napus TaxID=3708 RepID=A0ABQ8APF1_BRANA|nr:hypothetical protein HID58_056497 [Brassica napus]
MSNSETSSEIQKRDYIHVRARRGEATDRHSLAERARREIKQEDEMSTRHCSWMQQSYRKIKHLQAGNSLTISLQQLENRFSFKFLQPRVTN